ncbi:MAG: diphthine synthase [Thermoplasmatota archaeon]
MGALVFVGLGLWDERDISLAGLDEVKRADDVFLEAYTAHLGGSSVARLEALFAREVRVLTRADVEDGKVVLEAARRGTVVLLAAGDALTATTHTELRARAARDRIATRIVHGASIVSAAAGLLGLASYKFGRATTLVFPEGDYFPTSPFDAVRENLERGLHTLVLLDLRAGGSEHENRAVTGTRPGAEAPAAPRYMTAAEGAALLIRLGLPPDHLLCAVARAGSPTPLVVSGPARALAAFDFGPPLHVLVVPGKLHFSEEEALAALTRRVG